MPSQNNRDALKRKKLDFAEWDADSLGAYKTGSLASHRRPYTLTVANRPTDTVRDRGATLPLPGASSSSASSDSSSSSTSSVS